MTLNDPERRDARGQIFQADVLMTLVPLTHNDQIRQGNTCGEQRISRAAATLPQQGAGPQRSPVLGFASIYAYTLLRRMAKFDVVTYMERRPMGQPRPRLKKMEPQRSPVLGVLFYLCLHLLMQNDYAQQGNVGRCVYLVVSHISHPKGRSTSCRDPRFWISSLFICLHRLTQNDQIRRGIIWQGVF